jgi:putative addiction module component (TIGR02574 family)
MVDAALRDRVRQLAAEDRLDLMIELWESLDTDDMKVTGAEQDLLDGRLADHEANPRSRRPGRRSNATSARGGELRPPAPTGRLARLRGPITYKTIRRAPLRTFPHFVWFLVGHRGETRGSPRRDAPHAGDPAGMQARLT